MRVTKSAWYAAGGLSNLRCYRKQASNGAWRYYMRGFGAPRFYMRGQ